MNVKEEPTVPVEEMDDMEDGPNFENYEARVVEVLNFIKKKLSKIKGLINGSESQKSDFCWWKSDNGYYFVTFKIMVPRNVCCTQVEPEDSDYVRFEGEYCYIRGSFAHQALIYAQYKILKETYPRMSRVVNPKIVGSK